jgi:uncharacterized LabA/DUF88 family protein
MVSYDRRWMVFVDGQDYTNRSQAFAIAQGRELSPGPYHMRDVYFLPGTSTAYEFLHQANPELVRAAFVRAYYYTSVVGDAVLAEDIRNRLWASGFTAEVFQRSQREMQSKGVHITLTKDILSHAFLNSYDVAVLVAGDGEYVPLVQELKRLGKIVYVVFYGNQGTDAQLRRASDKFIAIDDFISELLFEELDGHFMTVARTV